MRLKSFVLCSASAAALVLAASPAFAQDAQPASPPDPNVQAQTNPADPDQAAPQPADTAQNTDDGETIVVTGLRRSLQSARNIKRNSDQIVDAVVAEDIGKLPDTTVSDTAARIPGVQVERSGGEASRVLVRGLDAKVFAATTYNGREVFTAETRTVALQDFPAGAIAAVEAFKTSTADLVEPGLAGLVNVRSRRPFDFKGFEVAGSGWLTRPNQSRDVGVNGNILASNRWDVGGGELGALLGVSYTELHFQDSIRRHGFFIADLAGGRSPDWPEIRYNESERWRPSVNGSVQWRPSNDLQFYAEGLWQGYRERQKDRSWEQPLWSCGPGAATYSDIVFDGDSNRIISGSVDNPGCPRGYRAGIQGATKRRTDTYQFAVGGSYDAGALKITGDLARSRSKFNLKVESVDYQLNTNDFTVNWFTGRVGGRGPTFEVVGIDPADPTIFEYRGLFESRLTAKGDDWQARLDAEYEPGFNWLPRVKTGLRYVDRDASRVVGDRFAFLGDLNISISDVPLQYELFQPAFHGDNHKPFPTTWLSPTFNSIWNNLTEIRQFNDSFGRGFGTGDPAPDPNRTYTADEKSIAGYAQLHYEFDLGGVPVDGQLGLRVVRTRDRLTGTINVPGSDPVGVDRRNSYTDWLPNLNVRAGLTRGLYLRLAATQTRTRPEFNQLNPSLALDPPVICPPAPAECIRRASGGNPFLKPLNSNNYDAALEWYFSSTGLAAVTAFRRDMRGFIANTSFELPGTDENGATIIVGGPVNTNKGRITGFEGQVRSFFDFDFLPQWARSFGAEANVTYLDAKADFLLFPGDARDPLAGGNRHTRRLRIPDVSKWSYNLVGMYERGGLTARLSYNWRGKYQEGDLEFRDNFFTLQGRGRGGSRLDWSSSYAFNDNLTLFFDWTNILKRPFKSDIQRVNYGGGDQVGFEEFPMVVRFEETILSGGVRFRF